MKSFLSLFRQKEGFISLIGADFLEIKAAERALQVTFATEYVSYLREIGLASYAGHELTGLCQFKRLMV